MFVLSALAPCILALLQWNPWTQEAARHESAQSQSVVETGGVRISDYLAENNICVLHSSIVPSFACRSAAIALPR